MNFIFTGSADKDCILGFIPSFGVQVNTGATACLASPNAAPVKLNYAQWRYHDFTIQHAPPMFLFGSFQIIADFQRDAFNRVWRDAQSDDAFHHDRSSLERSRLGIEDDHLPFES